jgi:hypothetical protein
LSSGAASIELSSWGSITAGCVAGVDDSDDGAVGGIVSSAQTSETVVVITNPKMIFLGCMLFPLIFAFYDCVQALLV